MALAQLLERVKIQVQRWFHPPAPVVERPVTPKKSMAEVELPPVVGLNKSRRYHRPDCGFVQHAKGQVVPFRTKVEAHEHGLEPCHVCKPSPN